MPSWHCFVLFALIQRLLPLPISLAAACCLQVELSWRLFCLLLVSQVLLPSKLKAASQCPPRQQQLKYPPHKLSTCSCSCSLVTIVIQQFYTSSAFLLYSLGKWKITQNTLGIFKRASLPVPWFRAGVQWISGYFSRLPSLASAIASQSK